MFLPLWWMVEMGSKEFPLMIVYSFKTWFQSKCQGFFPQDQVQPSKTEVRWIRFVCFKFLDDVMGRLTTTKGCVGYAFGKPSSCWEDEL